MIEVVPPIKRTEIFILTDKNTILHQGPLPVVSENGDIAKVVLEEDVVARYVKTGTRVAIKHILAIVAAMKVYQTLQKGNEGGDLLAKSAAMATYVGASKGIAAFEKADTRHWTTLPQALSMIELKLPPGSYKIGIAAYNDEKVPTSPTAIVGELQVKDQIKTIYTFPLQ